MTPLSFLFSPIRTRKPDDWPDIRCLMRSGTSGFMGRDGIGPKAWLDNHASCPSMSVLEVNETFYRKSMSAATATRYLSLPHSVAIVLKMWRGVTHAGLSPALAMEWWDAVSALHDRVSAVLVQLPPSRSFSSPALEKLLDVCASCSCQVVVEFRHRSWLCATALCALEAAGVSVCGTAVYGKTNWMGDFPCGLYLPPPSLLLRYVRVHGARKYRGALKAADRAAIVADGTDFVVFNNCVGQQAMRDALVPVV